MNPDPTKLRRLIEHSHKKIVDIEKEAGLAKNSLHAFLGGKVKKPHEDSLRGLAAVFGLELNDFISKISEDDAISAKSFGWNGELHLAIIHAIQKYVADNNITDLDYNYVMSVCDDLYAHSIKQNRLDLGTCEVLLRFAFKNMKK